MKKFTLLMVLAFASFFVSAQVGVGTPSPDPNAQLDIVSTSKGMLIPRLDAGQVTTLTNTLVGVPADPGMIIYNTTEGCIQVFDGTVFECLAIVTGGGLGNAGVVKVNIQDPNVIVNPGPDQRFQNAREARDADNTSFPGYMAWTSQTAGTWFILGNSVAPVGSYDFTDVQLNLSGAPTTNWPENTDLTRRNLDQTPLNGEATSAIYRNANPFEDGTTGDAWLENDIEGQVHIWRIIVYGAPGASNGAQLECRLRNPESGFVTGYVQVVPDVASAFSQTFTLTTIADDVSLPSGTGDGYVLEFRSSKGAGEIWVDSITRISIYNE